MTTKTNGPPPSGDGPPEAPSSAYVAPKLARDTRPEAEAGAETARKAVRKPVRVRKARHSGACPVCRHLILVGDLIASVKGGPFMCLAHLARGDTA